MRTLLIGALAATLAGCSRQPPPQAAAGSCTGTNGPACLERTAGPPIKLGTFRINSAAMDTRSASAQKPEKSSSAHARHGARLGSKTAKSTRIAAKAEPPASRVPLPHSSPKTQLQPAGNAVATESETARAHRGATSHRRPYQFQYQNDRGTGGGRSGARGAYNGCYRRPGAGYQSEEQGQFQSSGNVGAWQYRKAQNPP